MIHAEARRRGDFGVRAKARRARRGRVWGEALSPFRVRFRTAAEARKSLRLGATPSRSSRLRVNHSALRVSAPPR